MEVTRAFWGTAWFKEEGLNTEEPEKGRGACGRLGLKRGSYVKVANETSEAKLARKKKQLAVTRAEQITKRQLAALPRQQRKAAKLAAKHALIAYWHRFHKQKKKILREAWQRTPEYKAQEAAKKKAYSEKNKDRISARAKKNYAKRYKLPENYKKNKLSGIKCRARDNDLEFNLTVENVHWPKRCPVFGTKLRYRCGNGYQNTPHVPSIDRIDPTKGYTLDNIQVISMLANFMKTNATEEQLKMFAEWILDSQKNSEK